MRGREVLGCHPGPVRERRLGGAVGDEAAVGGPAHHRADRDHRLLAVRALEHQRHRRPGERVRGGDIEAERLGEEPRAGLQEAARKGAADVVDHGVDPAELVVRRLREPGDRVEVAEVGGDDDRLATGSPDLRGDLLELVRRTRGDDDVRTRLGESDGGGGAESAAGAGDDGDLALDREAVEDAHVLTSPRPVTSGRSIARTMPGSAATTAGSALMIRCAVVIIPETLWSPCSP